MNHKARVDRLMHLVDRLNEEVRSLGGSGRYALIEEPILARARWTIERSRYPGDPDRRAVWRRGTFPEAEAYLVSVVGALQDVRIYRAEQTSDDEDVAWIVTLRLPGGNALNVATRADNLFTAMGRVMQGRDDGAIAVGAVPLSGVGAKGLAEFDLAAH